MLRSSNRQPPRPLDRRQFLAEGGLGLGTLALYHLLAEDGLLRAGVAPRKTFAGPARRVIFLFMAGAPSQVDLWDPKPELAKLDGQDVPPSLAKNVPRIKRAGLKNLMASPFKFKPHGQSGIPVSQLLPKTARHVDDLCVLRSLHHRNPVHGPAEVISLTGTQLGDRPSLGAWLSYGLGSETSDLPAFVVMNVHSSGMQFPQAAGWSTGFLPARFQGVRVQAADGFPDSTMPKSYTKADRRRQLELINWMNRRHADSLGQPTELEARIRSYELAFRMQTSGPELFELSGETQATRRQYGLDRKATRSMGAHCLLARRMIERGVRFVQLRYGGWDAHSNLVGNHRRQTEATDQPIAALLADLKQRGLLDDTLVVWGGEFGRTPTMEGRKKGRDHSPGGYCMWLSGGGIQGGQIIGQTDAIGYTPVERPVRPSDLHATILHALGIDQHELTYQHNGRKELVTVLGGDVLREAFVSR